MEIRHDKSKNISNVSADKILELAFEVIHKADDLIPCSTVLIECNHNPKVQKIYTDHQFKLFQKGKELDQFYRLL